MKKKKLLIINSHYYPDVVGGAEISTKLLAEDLKENYKVSVLTVGKQRNKVIFNRINGILIIRIPNFNIYWANKSSGKKTFFLKIIWHILDIYNPIQKRLLIKIISKIDPDIANSQNLMGIGTYLWKILNSYSIPIVHTLRDYSLLAPTSNKFFNYIYSKVTKRQSSKVNSVVGVSKYILTYFNDRGYFNNSKDYIIHNIVKSRSVKTNSNSLDSRKPLTIGYFGQLEKNKGADLLFSLLKKCEEKVVKKLIIYGNGSLRDEFIRANKIDDRIAYRGHGTYNEVQSQMALCDIVIVPSRWNEPFGRVIIESYRQGTMVIASNVGGIPEIIYDKRFLFKPGNVNELLIRVKQYFERTSKSKHDLSEQLKLYSNHFLENRSDYLKVYLDLV